jgi:hypothetical protein
MQGTLTLGPHLANDGIQDQVNLPLEPKEGIRAALSVRHRQKRVAVWWLPTGPPARLVTSLSRRRRQV